MGRARTEGRKCKGILFKSVWAKTWERDSLAVNQRASVELTCPAEQLQLTILAVHVSGDAEKIGVDGCGNHGVYDRSEGGWVPSSKDKGAR